MFGLPANTEVGTQLPKKSIYAKFAMNSSEKDKFDADISRIVATGPLSQIVLYTLAPDMLVGLASKWSVSADGIVPDTAQVVADAHKTLN